MGICVLLGIGVLRSARSRLILRNRLEGLALLKVVDHATLVLTNEPPALNWLLALIKIVRWGTINI